MEQLQSLKEKLQKAKLKGKEEKIEKYKKQIKELKKQIKAQENESEEEPVEVKPKKKVKLSQELTADSDEEQEKAKKKSKKSKKHKKSEQIEIEEEEEEVVAKKSKKHKKSKQIESEETQEEEEEIKKSDKKKSKKHKKSKEEEQSEEEQEQVKEKKSKKQKKSEQIEEEEQDEQQQQEEQESNEYEQIKEKIANLKEKLQKAKENNKEEKIEKLKQKLKTLKAEKSALQNKKMDQEHKEITDIINQKIDQEKENFSQKTSRKTSTDVNPIKKTENVEELITIVLFYQYIEPEWTHKRYREAMAFTQKIGQDLSLGGRLRVAYEGFNGTISGSYKNIRQFCEELRKWEPENFTNTFFKFIDGLPLGTHFPKLKVFEVKELVNYGLHGNQPHIGNYGGVHLPPTEYHKKMEDDNTVIIDVRNTYESIIGKFDPPDQSKCKWLDPKWRRSTEIVDWLKKEETMKELRGKQVLMYCTGGVRCERASAYFNQEIGDQVKGIYQLKGGIEQYMLEYPEGGYWKGKNYTFDKRFAIQAYDKHDPNEEILSTCAGCDQPCDRYRGKKRCSACLVPILVCRECHTSEQDKKRNLRCTLCVEENVMPKPKRVPIMHKVQTNLQPSQPAPNPDGVTRLFVGNLPFDAKDETVRSLFRPAKIKNIQWLTDKQTGKFYGSVFIDTETPECAGYCLAVAGRKLKGREVRVKYEARKAQ